ncbi:nonribosomal peptide synthase [Aspergillus ambiguus]|uniref:nonribosomal peptide synthase n=1 Tax=Aspergillus ambiguus TaxID=176160 RepID=UPI003CCDBE09
MPVADICLIGGNNMDIVAQWNRPSLLEHEDLCIHSVISEQCHKYPNAEAVHAWDGSLTYGELDKLSDYTAKRLMSVGVGIETVVPIYLEKSKWVMVSILGILKAGAAFTLLDHSFPTERLRIMCKDVEASVIITSQAMAPKVRDLAANIVLIPDDMLRTSTSSAFSVSLSAVTPANAAYLAFTSGSTGKPKGIVVEHRSFCGNMRANQEVQNLDAKSRVLQFASFAFDISIQEILSPLMIGACVCMPSEDQRVNRLAKTIQEFRANWLELTPSVARLLSPDTIPDVKTLVLGGEPMRPDDMQTWIDRVQLMGAYGPAECSVVTTVQQFTDSHEICNIGRPHGGHAWIVDPNDHDQLSPIGCVGELVVSGPLVARGYINQPAQTAFIRPPKWASLFDIGPREKFYKTGDLVRWDLDSNSLLFRGRKDTQVKLHGQRLELQEVERQAEESGPENMLAVAEVVEPENGLNSKVLALFVTHRDTQSYENEVDSVTQQERCREWIPELQATLQQRLPPFMVPTLYIPLESLPLGPTGKLDRRALKSIGGKHMLNRSVPVEQAADSQADGRAHVLSAAEITLKRVFARVLGLPEEAFGPHDAFFSLGGTSISAITTVSCAREEGLALTATDILSLQTVSQLATVACETEDIQAVPTYSLIANHQTNLTLAAKQCQVQQEHIEDIYPCTPVQEALMVLSTKQPGSLVGTFSFYLSGSTDLDLLQCAWARVAMSNPILRTRIVTGEDSRLLQVVEKEAARIMHGDTLMECLGVLQRPMDLGTPLVRVGFADICGAGDPNPVLILVMHHAVFDGRSYMCILEDLHNSLLGEPIASRPQFNQVIDYIAKVEPTAAMNYWAQEFNDLHAPVFPATVKDWMPPEKPCIERKRITLGTIPAGGSQLATAIRLAWAMVTSVHTSSNDVVYGMTVSGCNAPIPQVEKIPGPTIATFPTRVRIDPGQSVQEALDSILQNDIARIPFEQVGISRIRQASSDAALACGFQTLLVIQPKRVESNWSTLRDLSRNSEQQHGFNTNMLTILVELGDDSISIEAIFDGSILSTQETQALLNRFEAILQQVLTDGSATLGSIQICTPAEQQLIKHWSQRRIFGPPTCVHNIISNWAVDNPEKEAIRAWDGSFTFIQLVDHARALASHLQCLGATPEAYVGICMERSKWFPVALLGVMISGAAFILLDANFPVDRLQNICSDANADIIVVSQRTSEKCHDLGIRTTVLNENTACSWQQTMHHGRSSKPHNAAYVAFTSGSSGTPKGVVIEHGMLYYTLAAYQKVFSPRPGYRSMFFSSPAFDSAVIEVLVVLGCGGCICIPTEDERFNNLAGAIRELQVEFAILTPSVARTLLPSEIPSLETLWLVGESVSASDIATWTPTTSLFVGYGPAECTILTTACRLEKVSQGPPEIGYPPNGSCWVTHPSNHDQLAPPGVTGELVIGGPTVGRCYINRPKETAKAFITNPKWAAQFGLPEDQRLYKTGDLVKYKMDGSLQFIGRKDTQVKLHGQRLELEEIEQCVRDVTSDITAVADVVQFTDTPVKQLALFVYAAGAHAGAKNGDSQEPHKLFIPPGPELESEISALRDHLGRVLPAFMVPSVYVRLSHLPLTPTGKTNRKLLREQAASTDRKSVEGQTAYTVAKAQPSTERERLVREIFADALLKDESEIGIHDNFFTLGDSISAMRVLNMCRQEGLQLTMPKFLVNNTVSLVASSASITSKTQIESHMEEEGKPFPLSPIQSMFCEMVPSTSSRFNQSFFVRLEREYSISQWEKALEQIVDHHSMLRMRLISRKEQVVTPDVKGSFLLSSHKVPQTEDITGVVEEAQGKVDPVRGPVLVVDHITTSQGDKYVSFIASHLVVDLVSWRVMLDDLENILKGKSLPPERPLSFSEWVRLQSEECKDYVPQQVLPFDVPIIDMDYWGLSPQENLFGDGIFEEFSLDQETTLTLMGAANKAFNSQPQEIFNAALLYSFLYTFQDRPAPTIFNESHGREAFDADIDPFRTVGWFTTIWPCAVPRPQDHCLTELVRRIKDASRLVPGNGQPYFSSRYLSPQCREAFAEHAPVEILVNYAGQYQQLERQDAVFSQPAWRPDPRLDVAKDMPRFAMFDVSLEVSQNRLNASIFYSGRSAKQAKIRSWVSNFQSTLHELAHQLRDLPRQLSLSDVPLVQADYSELSSLHNAIQKSLGVPSISAVEDIYPCSDAHVGLIEGLTGTAAHHKARSLWQIKESNNLDARTVAEAWNRVIQRHPVMRTILVSGGVDAHKFIHVVMKQTPLNVPILRSASADEAKETLMQLRKPRSMQKSPPHFFAVCQNADGQTFFMFESGNALIDAASLSILLHDFCMILDGAELSGVPPRYREYISYLSKAPGKKGLPYWKQALSGVRPCLFPRLVPCRMSPCESGQVYTLKRFMKDPDTLNSFWRSNGLTATNIFQLAWAVVMCRFTGHKDTVGPFFNILPCRLRLDPEVPTLDLLRQNQAAMQNRLENQHCSLLDVIKCTGLQPDGLLNTCLTVQPALSSSYSVNTGEAGVGLEMLEYDDPTEFALCCAVLLSPTSVEVNIRYMDTFCNSKHASKVADDFMDTVHRIVQGTGDVVGALL